MCFWGRFQKTQKRVNGDGSKKHKNVSMLQVRDLQLIRPQKHKNV